MDSARPPHAAKTAKSARPISAFKISVVSISGHAPDGADLFLGFALAARPSGRARGETFRGSRREEGRGEKKPAEAFRPIAAARSRLARSGSRPRRRRDVRFAARARARDF